MSFSSIVSDIKSVLVDLPTIRTAVVSGLAAGGALLAVIPHAGTGVAAVAGAVTGAAAFLASPKVIAILNDIASAVTPQPVKAIFRRKP
jgi:hypothetical protein